MLWLAVVCDFKLWSLNYRDCINLGEFVNEEFSLSALFESVKNVIWKRISNNLMNSRLISSVSPDKYKTACRVLTSCFKIWAIRSLLIVFLELVVFDFACYVFWAIRYLIIWISELLCKSRNFSEKKELIIAFADQHTDKWSSEHLNSIMFL